MVFKCLLWLHVFRSLYTCDDITDSLNSLSDSINTPHQEHTDTFNNPQREHTDTHNSSPVSGTHVTPGSMAHMADNNIIHDRGSISDIAENITNSSLDTAINEARAERKLTESQNLVVGTCSQTRLVNGDSDLQCDDCLTALSVQGDNITDIARHLVEVAMSEALALVKADSNHVTVVTENVLSSGNCHTLDCGDVDIDNCDSRSDSVSVNNDKTVKAPVQFTATASSCDQTVQLLPFVHFHFLILSGAKL